MHFTRHERRPWVITLSAWIAIFAVGCVPASAPSFMPALAHDAVVRSEPTPRPFAAETNSWTCDGVAEHLSALGPPSARPYPLRGDPSFDATSLAAGARLWYDLLWDAVEDPAAAERATALAASDDLYEYGRTLHTHVLALLTAFRVTGDLALLDEVDRLAEHMRSRLRDPWRGTSDGTDGTRDGYLNWVYRQGDAPSLRGKDLFAFNEMRTHALVAEITAALHANRDLTSPNGVDYGRSADAWIELLLRHFEPKWRARNDTPRSAFPFLEHSSMHATAAFVKYHHYLSVVLGEADRDREARRLADLVLDAFVFVPTDAGPSVVWPGRVPTPEDSDRELNATTYARYVVGDVIDLHLDGRDRFRDPALAAALAVTVRSFVFQMGDGTPTFAADIGGGVAQAEMRPPDPDRLSTFTVERYVASGLALVSPWDPTGLVAAWSCAAYREAATEMQSVWIPSALLLAFAVERQPSEPSSKP